MPSLDLIAQMPLTKRWTNDHEGGEALPPDVSMINGRLAEDWEQEGKMRALLAARERDAALVKLR